MKLLGAKLRSSGLIFIVNLFVLKATAGPLAFSIDADENLVTIDLGSEAISVVAELGGDFDGGDTEAMAVDPTSGVLYLATDGDKLYTVNQTTAEATLVGSLGVDYGNGGMAISGAGEMFLVTSDGLFSVDKTSGAATRIGADLDPQPYGNEATYDSVGDEYEGLSGAAFIGTTLYASYDNDGGTNLYTVNTQTGLATTVGQLFPKLEDGDQTGLTYDVSTDTLYLMDEEREGVFTVNYSTGAATLLFSNTLFSELEAIALAEPGNPLDALAPPAPVPTLPFYGLFALGGLLALIGTRRQRKQK